VAARFFGASSLPSQQAQTMNTFNHIRGGFDETPYIRDCGEYQTSIRT